MRPLPADWTAIRLLAQQGVSQSEISRQTGIAIGTIAARSQREGWIVQAKAAQVSVQTSRQLAAVDAGQMQANASDGVKLGAETIAARLDSGRLSRSRYVQRASARLATLSSARLLEEAANAKAVAGVAEQLEPKAKTGPRLNVNIFTADPFREVQVEGRVVEQDQ